jgi:hypothetical protein
MNSDNKGMTKLDWIADKKQYTTNVNFSMNLNQMHNFQV